ncbi:hypothetical protein [Aphanothece sacrum]|uniref:CopG family transcriptional regulator n=1 Tax=Aphanothece sacrum FPU1 TaxID=1920663 RepID=A0A401IN39_APHSA|nr:hypothetical protein [Aphanothece sacrum]GBF82661.1 hypothetical protein AsFPU1_4093 [Aphanothece sacrum FPU1]GBF84547.1 toxin-antitoxin system, antitoxin component [Aphanothece sacrum FPU3]
MKAKYDFSQGEQGKFYHPDVVFEFPIYLEPDVNEFMTELAKQQGVEINILVNEWLRSQIKKVDEVRSS